MRTSILKFMTPIFVGCTTSAFAATSGLEQGGNGILIWFLIGFGVMVLLFQATPAMVMFSSMLKGMFSGHNSAAPFSAQKGKGK